MWDRFDVIARQWSWEFIYPNGVRSSELHLPIDQRVNFQLQSQKTFIHSFYVPAFRLKQDIIPGSIISYSLTPTRKGRFRLRDAMFSGAYFSVNQIRRHRRIRGGVLRLAEDVRRKNRSNPALTQAALFTTAASPAGTRAGPRCHLHHLRW